MADPRGRLATLIVSIVLLTLLAAFFSASLALWIAGDWKQYGSGLDLTLRIMWGSWLVLFVAALLTYATFVGWHFRKARPNEGPTALMQAIAAGMKPSAWLKTGATSFTITVVLVSLLGVAVLASVLIWIIGDWSESRPALVLTLKLIWGAWWVLCIATVLTRIAIFGWQRRKAGYGPRPEDEFPDDAEQTSTEKAERDAS
jgi:hypothetical protein